MKKISLFSIFLFTLVYANSQVAIKITVDRESKVDVSKTGDDKEKNKLIIDNNFERDECTVILKTNKPSTFVFGRNGQLPLRKGQNSFEFNSSGLVKNYPENVQRLISPFDLTILDKHDSILFTTQVTFLPKDATQPDETARLIGLASENKENLTKIPFYDALVLSNYRSIPPKQYEKILNFYLGEKNLSGNALIEAYKDNLFLSSFIKEALAYYKSKNLASSGGFGDFIGKGLSSIGGLDVTSFADGAARFIVKRAKQELSISFFRKFKKILEETPDMGTVFPVTTNLLFRLDEEIYEYEKYLQNLREAFKKDIQEIHRNLPGIIDNHPAFFTKNQEVKAALLTACYTAQELEDQAHPGDILANYPIEYLDSIANKNYKGSIQTIQLLSASLRDTSSEENAPYWVNIKQIRELVNDRLALKIYLGLILQEAKVKYDGVAFEGTTLVNLLDSVAVKYETGFSIYNSYRTYILKLGEKVEALNKMISEYKDQELSDSGVIEKYAKYFRVSVDLIGYSAEICNLPIIKDQDEIKKLPLLLKKYFDVAYVSADLVIDITRKNYSSAINDAVRIYNLVTLDKNEFKSSLGALIKYGSFMATVATAKNSTEVQKAIETAALPVGSSRIKRVSDFNVSLNAYAGLFYGIERIKDFDSGSAEFNTFGVSAPIGVGASWGHRLFFIPTGKSEWSTSIYLSLIDLGAVTAFRFKDDSTEQVPTIQLQDIFSPGAFLSIGIPRTALSFNLGAQAGPNLRKVSASGNDYSDNMYWRYSVSFCVDIPIFNFYTKSK